MTRRYLDLLKSSLSNELYVENDVRMLYISAMLATGQPVDPEVVRRVGELAPELFRRVRDAKQEGLPWAYWPVQAEGKERILDLRNMCAFSHTMVGRRRLDNLEHCLDAIRLDGVPGDVIETGVWRGGACIFMRGYLAAHDERERKVWVADSFEGLPAPSLPEDAGYDFSGHHMPILAVPLEEVRENFRRYGLLDEQVEFVKGWFKDTLHKAAIGDLALARLDGDLYESTMDALDALYKKIVPGGFIVIDDYLDFEPCTRAVEEFREFMEITTPIQPIDAGGGAYWRKEKPGGTDDSMRRIHE
jgi:O-methyltransferase